MNCKEVLSTESENTGQILMFREGNFWRAYERSAYAFVKYVNSLKAVKRAYKALGGETLVYVGFPTSSESKYLEGRDDIVAGQDINAIEAADMRQTEREAQGIYDMQDRKLDNLHHGLNIVRMSDGSMRKVMKK